MSNLSIRGPAGCLNAVKSRQLLWTGRLCGRAPCRDCEKQVLRSKNISLRLWKRLRKENLTLIAKWYSSWDQTWAPGQQWNAPVITPFHRCLVAVEIPILKNRLWELSSLSRIDSLRVRSQGFPQHEGSWSSVEVIPIPFKPLCSFLSNLCSHLACLLWIGDSSTVGK